MNLFDVDRWQEIFSTLRRNRLRTFMTAFGVFWGIFMLVLLLSFGTALEKGAHETMPGFGSNQIFVWGGRVTRPYKGMQPGRRVRYDVSDIDAIASVDGVYKVAPRTQLGGYRGANNVSRGAKTGSFSVMGDFPAWAEVSPFEYYEGRFINELDIRDKRKVAVIGEDVYKELFEPGESTLGKTITIQGVYFQVVGRVHSTRQGHSGERDAATIYIPFTTYQQAFNGGNRVNWFAMLGEKGVPAELVEDRVKALLRERKTVHPEDSQAIGGYNAAKQVQKMDKLFGGIRLFMWFVGLATLFAGVLGVSNIMLIVVRERTREIGVRKALGARPWSIIGMVMQESITLTTIAGYVGLVAGVGLTELIGNNLKGKDVPLGHPEIDFGVAITATIILIIAGGIAGLIPARQAAAVNPVEALRAS